MWQKPLKLVNDNRPKYCELRYRIKALLLRELLPMPYTPYVKTVKIVSLLLFETFARYLPTYYPVLC